MNFQVEKLQEGIGASEKSMCLLSERKSGAVNEINLIFGDLFEKLRERRQKLLEDLDSQFVSKMDQIRKFLFIISTWSCFKAWSSLKIFQKSLEICWQLIYKMWTSVVSSLKELWVTKMRRRFSLSRNKSGIDWKTMQKWTSILPLSMLMTLWSKYSYVEFKLSRNMGDGF